MWGGACCALADALHYAAVVMLRLFPFPFVLHMHVHVHVTVLQSSGAF
jgi:hypothetical protein